MGNATKRSAAPAGIRSKLRQLTAWERSSMRAVSGLSEVTIKVLYSTDPGRTVRESSRLRAIAAADALGLPHPPAREDSNG